MIKDFGSRAIKLSLALLVLAAMAWPGQAQAWWRGGVWFGVPPIVVGVPGYYAPGYYPPAYYPAPVYYPPAATAAPAYSAPVGQACYADAYVCPLDTPGPAGSPCSCPANKGRVSGKIG